MDPPGRLPWMTAVPLETRRCPAVGRLWRVRHALARALPRRMDPDAGGCPARGRGGVPTSRSAPASRTGEPALAPLGGTGRTPRGRGATPASLPLSPLRRRAPHIGGCHRPLFFGAAHDGGRIVHFPPWRRPRSARARRVLTHSTYTPRRRVGLASLFFFFSFSSAWFFFLSVQSGAASPPRRRGGARLFLNCTINPCLGHPAATSATSASYGRAGRLRRLVAIVTAIPPRPLADGAPYSNLYIQTQAPAWQTSRRVSRFSR